MKTITKYVIEIDQAQAIKRLISNFMGALQDNIDDVEYFMMDLSRIHEILQEIENTGRMENVFKDGYTMMVLPDEDMENVENFFRRTKDGADDNQELEIHIMNDLGIKMETIPQRHIMY